ncbi:MAG TPA: hypothetical protein VFE84_13540, partial [Patescibacteria group bacterium]|nr:hypothetical protein [Patescibacteria group bacterium]
MSRHAPEAVEKLASRSLAAGLAMLAFSVVGAFFDLDQFFRSYLLAYVFWLGVALGCLAIVMIQHITGGAWGAVIRRLLEAGARTIPVMGLLFVPLAFGLKSLYPWARPDLVAADELLQHKQAYLNVTFFLLRALVYFAAWSALAWRLSRMSGEQDRTGDERLIRRFVLVSAGGLLV